MRRSLAVSAALVLLAASLGAQGASGSATRSRQPAKAPPKAPAKPSVLVYPFGVAADARIAINGDVAGIFASRTIEGVQASGRFAAIDESANPAVKAQLENAGTLDQFESAVQLRRDRQLQSQYLLTGFVQSVGVKQVRGKDRQLYFEATVSGSVNLINVETREVLATEAITVSNGMLTSVTNGQKRRGGLFGAIAGAAGQVMSEEAARNIGGSVGGAMRDQTAAAAVESALKKVPDAVSKLLEENIP